MDWSLEDNMVGCLFFSGILTGIRGGHSPTPFVQAGAETDTGAEAVKSDPRCSWESHSRKALAGVRDKSREYRSVAQPLTFHWLSAQCATRTLLSDELMRCCLRRVQMGVSIWRAFALDGRVSAEWSRCPGSMARRVGESVAPLWQSSAGWMPARIGRLSANVVRRHPVTIRKTSLMTGSIRRIWVLRHQTGVQYSEVECSRARVTISNVVAPAPQPEPASCLKSVTRDVNFLHNDSRCRRYVSDLSNVTPRYSIWVRSRRVGFCCCGWLLTHF